MVKNFAGGYVFKSDKWNYLESFLILGTEGGSYYAKPKALTVKAAKNVIDCIAEDARKVVDMTVSVSQQGLAPRNAPALFVMALCMSPQFAAYAGDRSYASSRLPEVARTASDLFSFIREVDHFRGWGKQMKNAVNGWYESHAVSSLAYQMAKYQSRAGWSHRDLLRKVRPTAYGQRNLLYRYAVKGAQEVDVNGLPALIGAVERIKTADKRSAVSIIREHRLTHEMVPNELKGDPAIWSALLESMPVRAMIRNIANMTNKGVFANSDDTLKVIETLRNADVLKKARIHPINLLSAWNTYRKGHGLKGKLTWSPVRPIADALEYAFKESFNYIVPSNKRFLLGLDVSGSTTMYNLEDYGLDMSVREAIAVMALLTTRTEPLVDSIAFTSGSTRGISGIKEFKVSAHDSLEELTSRMNRMPFGGTDCSLPMKWALSTRNQYDVIVIYTDNETWAGSAHPSEALNRYRDAVKIPTKLISVGMVSNGFTIADPADPFSIDVVGFDSRAPDLISTFAAT